MSLDPMTETAETTYKFLEASYLASQIIIGNYVNLRSSILTYIEEKKAE